jgi:hypothetical protein
MNGLDDRDVKRAAKLLPAELRTVLQAMPGLVVAGGLVRAAVSGDPVSDIDVFARSRSLAGLAATAYENEVSVDTRQIETPNAITVLAEDGRRAVQFITRWTFDDPTRLIYSFDFSIARAAIWWEGTAPPMKGGVWASSCDSRFYVDLAARRLVFMSPQDNTAGGTLLRVQKFVRLGYRISAFQVAAVVMNLARQAGAEEEILRKTERLIKEVDPRSPEWEDEVEPAPATAADAPPTDDAPEF